MVNIYSSFVNTNMWRLHCSRKYAEKRKAEDYEETDAEIVLQTAVEAEDTWEEELNSFSAASRTTGLIFCYWML